MWNETIAMEDLESVATHVEESHRRPHTPTEQMVHRPQSRSSSTSNGVYRRTHTVKIKGKFIQKNYCEIVEIVHYETQHLIGLLQCANTN